MQDKLLTGSAESLNMYVDTFKVDSPNVEYGEEFIHASYDYDSTDVVYNPDGSVSVKPLTHKVEFKTARKVPKLGFAPHSRLLCV